MQRFKFKKTFFLYAFCIFAFSALVLSLPNGSDFILKAQAQTSKQLDDLNNKIKEYEAKVAELKTQGNSLSAQIEAMDNQIQLTEYRVNATKQEIMDITMDIDSATKRMKNLEGSLTDVSKVLLNRIVATYKAGGLETLPVLLTSDNFSDAVSRANYLRIVQAHDKQLLLNTQQARNDYANQKVIFEDKKKKIEALQKQLEEYTAQLDKDKAAKENLLKATKNDEKKYQDLLSKARSEFAGIQGILAGNGAETEAGPVSQGSRIASIIPGASCNSSGGHLHFIVSRNGATENPFSYLKSIDHNNCSGSSCGSSDGDSFNPSGSWDWPINGPVTMYQGYGSTWATRNTWVGQIYNFHNGIDIVGPSYEVKAVRSGTLYRGSYAGSSCRLPYVRVRHEDGLDTFYLHVYY